MLIYAQHHNAPKASASTTRAYAPCCARSTPAATRSALALMQALSRHLPSSEDPAFMTQWDTAMRYSKGSAIDPKRVDRWRDQAQQIVDAIGTT